jgi:hypothetical protein
MRTHNHINNLCLVCVQHPIPWWIDYHEIHARRVNMHASSSLVQTFDKQGAHIRRLCVWPCVPMWDPNSLARPPDLEYWTWMKLTKIHVVLSIVISTLCASCHVSKKNLILCSKFWYLIRFWLKLCLLVYTFPEMVTKKLCVPAMALDRSSSLFSWK